MYFFILYVLEQSSYSSGQLSVLVLQPLLPRFFFQMAGTIPTSFCLVSPHANSTTLDWGLPTSNSPFPPFCVLHDTNTSHSTCWFLISPATVLLALLFSEPRQCWAALSSPHLISIWHQLSFSCLKQS